MHFLLRKFIFKFDEDGNGTIEFAEFLVMMATKAKEAEVEEAENFLPCCFRVMRDKKGKTLRVKKVDISETSEYIFFRNPAFLLTI